MGGYLGKSVGGFTSVTEKRQTFNITTTTTQLTGLSYTPTKEEVHVNGIRYVRDVDYTANDGLTITLTNPLLNGDTAIVKSFPSFDVADTVSASNGGTFAGNVQMSGTLGVTGNTTVGGTLDVAGNTTVNSPNYGGIQLQVNGTNTGYITSFSGAHETVYIGGSDKLALHTGTNHGLSNGTTRLLIDADGNVTKPNQPMFRIRCANNNNVDGTVSGGVTLAGTGFYQSNTLVQTGSHFSVSTGRFTAPVNGYYYFNFSNRLDNVGSGYVYFTIMDNGGSVITRNLTNVTTTYQTLHCSAVHYMSANDYVFVRYDAQADAYVNLDSDGFFSGFLVG